MQKVIKEIKVYRLEGTLGNDYGKSSENRGWIKINYIRRKAHYDNTASASITNNLILSGYYSVISLALPQNELNKYLNLLHTISICFV